MTTKTSVPLPILGCLNKAGKFFGQDLVWTPTNEHQKEFILKVLGDMALMDEARTSLFLESNVDSDVNPINAWFARRGFSIKLDPMPSGSLALASILEILVKWSLEGEKTSMNIGGVDYAMAQLPRGTVSFYATDRTFVAKVLTDKPHITAHMAMVPEPMDDDSVHAMATKLTPCGKYVGNYEGLVFPMVDLGVNPDISWLNGMFTHFNGDVWYISQAVQQTVLKLNHVACLAKSAVAIVVERSCMPRPPMVIDKPFLFWLTNNELGHENVVFAAWLDKDCWKDPGTV